MVRLCSTISWVRLSKLSWSGLLLVALGGCASGTGSGDEADGPPTKCVNGYTVGDEGECAIPTLGPADLEAPDEEINPTLDNSDLDEQNSYFLNQEGDGKFVVLTNETIQIGVRAITYIGEAAADHMVTFETEPGGDPAADDYCGMCGSSLSAGRAMTNEFGVAHIRVTGGDRPMYFFIHMKAENTTGLRYRVDVVQPPEGHVPQGQPNPPGPVEPGNNCLETLGVYNIKNLYEPARVLGDGPFNALDQIHQVLSNPGRAAADAIGGRIGGIGGSLVRGAVEPVVNYLVEYIISNYAPDWAQSTLQVTEDITGLLTDLEIQGTLDLGAVAPAADCALTGKHRWERLVFFWRYGCDFGDEQCGRYEVELARMGISASESEFTARVTRTMGPVGDLTIDNHQMQMNYGVAVLWFIESFILPQRFNVGSFGELLAFVIPCEAAGQLAADYVSGVPFLGIAVRPLVTEACEAGLEWLGNYLTGLLAEQMNVNVFQLAGQCKMRDNNADRAADLIEDGRWTEGLQGDFSGERRQ